MLKTAPAVFAVGENYQIMVPVISDSCMWIKVGDETYYDEWNGVMRSSARIHRVTVPRRLLDAAKAYTVCEKVMLDRCPYFPKSMPVVEKTFEFRPVPEKGDLRFYHISDSHSRTVGPISAARQFGDIDFLVMVGDVPDDSSSVENLTSIYLVASELTHGNIPIVFARGNHDCRGILAESIAEYIPCSGGNTYYTFRIGSVWGLVLDCGEDKPDDHEEYGGTVCFHQFRVRQTEFIKKVISNADGEYAAKGVKHRLIIAHHPFTYRPKPPFDVEENIYREWTKLIGENIKPELLIAGHTHENGIFEKGGRIDSYGQFSTVIVGGKPLPEGDYIGCGVTLSDGCAEAVFTDSEKVLGEPYKIKF